MDKNVLVTGGAGYIGIHVVKRLLENGKRVVTLDDLSTGHQEVIDFGADLVAGLYSQIGLTQL